VEGLVAAYRDRFPLKVSWQGAGLEQTGAAGGPVVREVERVCGTADFGDDHPGISAITTHLS